MQGLDFLDQLVGDGKKFFGERLKTPEFPSLESILTSGTKANTAALSDTSLWAAGINKFTQAEVTKMLESVLPGFSSGLAGATKNAAALARGEIPDDVSRAVHSSAAAKALAGGFVGSGFGRNLVARDFGKTSLALTGEGQNRLTSLGAFARSAFPVFDMSQAFFNPAQMLDYTYNKFQRDLLAAKVAAAPDPASRGRADQQMAIVGMILSAYGGGPGYTGAGTNYDGSGNAPDSGGANRTIPQGYNGNNYGGFSSWQGSTPTNDEYNNWMKGTGGW